MQDKLKVNQTVSEERVVQFILNMLKETQKHFIKNKMI